MSSFGIVWYITILYTLSSSWDLARLSLCPDRCFLCMINIPKALEMKSSSLISSQKSCIHVIHHPVHFFKKMHWFDFFPCIFSCLRWSVCVLYIQTVAWSKILKFSVNSVLSPELSLLWFIVFLLWPLISKK